MNADVQYRFNRRALPHSPRFQASFAACRTDVAEGWMCKYEAGGIRKVYEPGSAHFPTVTGGRALVLYLLPEGAIEFTKTEGES